MKLEIIHNQTILRRQSDNIIKNELSNTAMVLQTPTILTEYFPINADLTVTSPGFKNIEEYIGPNSTAVYDHVDMFPMSGIDNLIESSQFDEEIGWEENFQSEAIIYPNTIRPKPYDCFIIKDAKYTALYVVTNIEQVTARSNPFTAITFRLYSRDPEVIAQLRRQVHKDYVTTVTSIGLDKSLVIEKESYLDIEHHVNQYIELAEMYRTLFYSERHAAFVIDGVYDPEGDVKQSVIDMTLWKFMFDLGIIIYDDVITFANNNYRKTLDYIFTGCPDLFMEEHQFHRSVLWRIYTKDTRHNFAEYRYPLVYEPSQRYTKYQGKGVVYIEGYGKVLSCNPYVQNYYVWDNDFLARIHTNQLYEETDLNSAVCTGCNLFCDGKPAQPYNPFIRNVIIKWFNGGTIDWDNIQINDDRTIENYTLIPLLLAIYKNYIQELQK